MTIRRSLTQQRGMNTGTGWWGGMGDPSVIPPPSAMGYSTAGVAVTERTVIGLMSVFSCIRIIGDIVADLEPHVFRKTGVGVNDLEVDAPLIITDPYADDDLFTGTFKLVASLGLGGNIYKQVIDRDSQGNPTLIENLNPALMKVSRVQGVKTYQIGATGKPLNPKDIIHVPWVSLAGSLVGLNPIEIGASGFGSNIAAEEYASRYFAQGLNPGGILSVTKPLLPADATRLQSELQNNHGGLANSHIPIVIDGGAKWENISINPDTAQLLESRAFSKAEISGFYGVPIVLLGDVAERGTTEIKGVEELLISWVLAGLKGYVKRLDIADTKLLPPGYVVRRDLNDIYKTNSQMLAMLLTSMRNASIATPNELRHIVNLPPSAEPAANSLFAPLNSNTTPDWAPSAIAGVPSTAPAEPATAEGP